MQERNEQLRMPRAAMWSRPRAHGSEENGGKDPVEIC